MRLAQQLYEGVDFGEGAVGLITYMRTDSVSLADEAVTEIRATIEKLYGKEGLAEAAARLQDQVEERAGSARGRAPDLAPRSRPPQVEGKIDADQFKLYCADLEARRRLPDGACRVRHRRRRHASPGRRAADAARHLLRANGSTLVKPGYIAVYQEGRDDAPEDDDDHVLPPMKRRRHRASCSRCIGEQHFTEPPPRFSRSLAGQGARGARHRPPVDLRLHHLDAARPRVRGSMDARRFTATDIGKIVNRFLTKYFTKYVEYGFTADMEDELDAVSRGEEPWITPLEKFWKPFIDQVEEIETNVSREEVAHGARPRRRSGEPAARCPCAWAASARSCRSAPRTTRRSRKFAGLRPGQKMDTITLADALELFKLPRTLGETAEGETVHGRHRPLRPVREVRRQVRLAEGRRSVHRHAASARIEVIEAKKVADANRIIQDFGVDDIQVLNGRYGPYITDKQERAHPQGPRSEDADARGMPRTARRGARSGRAGRFGRGARRNRPQKRRRRPESSALTAAAMAPPAVAAPHPPRVRRPAARNRPAPLRRAPHPHPHERRRCAPRPRRPRTPARTPRPAPGPGPARKARAVRRVRRRNWPRRARPPARRPRRGARQAPRR